MYIAFKNIYYKNLVSISHLAELSIWLKRCLDERDDRDPCLFITKKRPKRRMSIDNLRYIIKRIFNRDGIKKNIHPHQLRHSNASHMNNNGAPLEVIQSLLGHVKSETTKIYNGY
ncbi:hypothetical protein E6W99_16025 [Metabacillus sediminilitoris]|uniref:Uncharacterized protein n=1 Tax=Metabacillus sediminilitoris TaxID=2567941 RepID=A0A4V3WF34_9BACI|nr:tyrosine-type recombinase/integrase [Metabacillus sediminilitoris]THF78699.1 hypothetical protein E6W99_16025 [Metabacillus sediminilitoris]